jgi:hypothetical protein
MAPGLPSQEAFWNEKDRRGCRVDQPRFAGGFLEAGAQRLIAGWSSPVARQAHNLKVASSNLAPATKYDAAVAAQIRRPSRWGRPFACLKCPPSRGPLNDLQSWRCGRVRGTTCSIFSGTIFSGRHRRSYPVGWAIKPRNGPYGSISSDEPSDGVVTIVIEPEGGDESPLTEQDRAGVQWLLDHEAEVASAVLEGLLAEYPRLQRPSRCGSPSGTLAW